jgi:hypothetical protein
MGPPIPNLPSPTPRRWLLAAMIALLVARPLFPSESAASHGDGLTLVMLWLVLAAAWLLASLRRGADRLRFGWLDAAVAAMVTLEAIAGVRAAGRFSPRPAINMIWEWVGLGLVFLLARQLVRTGREARAIVAVMIALSAGIAGYGLYDYGIDMPATRAAYQVDPDGVMRRSRVWYPPDSPGRELFERRMESPEPLGTFALSNSLAALLAPWLVAALGIAAAGRDRRRRAAAVVCAAPIAVCLLLTRSRSAYIAVAIGALLIAWRGKSMWRRPATGRWKLLGGPGLLAAVLAAGGLCTGPGRNLLAKAGKSFGYRVEYWQSTLAMIAHCPLGGCGPGSFQDAYTRFKLPQASEEVSDPHNFLLEIWATAGTPGALALAAVLAGVFLSGRKNAKVGEQTGDGPDFRTSTGHRREALVGVGPKMGLSPLVHREGTSELRFIFAGLAAGFLLAWPLGQISAAPPGIRPLVVGLPIAAGCLLALSGWIRAGRLSAKLPVIALLVLVVDLSATGGISLPGIAASFWLLAAVGSGEWGVQSAECRVQSAEDRGGRTGDGPAPIVTPSPPHPLTPAVTLSPSHLVTLSLLTIIVVLAVACYATGYGPVLRCQRLLREAQDDMFSGDLAAAEEKLEMATRADPRSSDPCWQLAELTLADWLRQPDPEIYQRFEHYQTEMTRLAPQAASMWMTAGDNYLQAFSAGSEAEGGQSHFRPGASHRGPKIGTVPAQGRSLKAEALDKAVAAYRRGVELYPNRCLYVAKLALACEMAGQRDAAQREAVTALKLDRQTPHADQKLPAKLRRALEKSVLCQ